MSATALSVIAPTALYAGCAAFFVCRLRQQAIRRRRFAGRPQGCGKSASAIARPWGGQYAFAAGRPKRQASCAIAPCGSNTRNRPSYCAARNTLGFFVFFAPFRRRISFVRDNNTSVHFSDYFISLQSCGASDGEAANPNSKRQDFNSSAFLSISLTNPTSGCRNKK